MKKCLLPVVTLIGCVLIFCGCIKNTPYVTTINPYMTASIGTYTFVASATTPAVVDTQVMDTAHTLIITGLSSDRAYPHDQMVISIDHYRGVPGVYSMVQGQAGAYYLHNGLLAPASGGVIGIQTVSSTVITGYFSFNTVTGDAIKEGKFSVGTP